MDQFIKLTNQFYKWTYQFIKTLNRFNKSMDRFMMSSFTSLNVRRVWIGNHHLKRMKFGLFVKPHVSNKKLIMTKSDENQKLFWKNSPLSQKNTSTLLNTYFEEHLLTTDCFSDLKHHGTRVFHNIFFYFTKFWSFHKNPDNESSSECILVEILCVLFTLTSSFARDWKKSSS